jgi:site-specific recombinase XerD
MCEILIMDKLNDKDTSKCEVDNNLIIPKGFDRDVDFIPMKEKLILKYNNVLKKLLIKISNVNVNRLIYIVIALIQLRNGSRISEAVNAFKLFIVRPEENKVIVKIAKSDSTRYNKEKKMTIKSKPRFRKIMFPNKWIDADIIIFLKQTNNEIFNYETKLIKKRVLDYLLNNFKCNTHSLRYAFINHMLYQEKRPQSDVAKFVGHVNVNMLVKYTQLKNTEQIFDLDI